MECAIASLHYKPNLNAALKLLPPRNSSRTKLSDEIISSHVVQLMKYGV